MVELIKGRDLGSGLNWGLNDLNDNYGGQTNT